MAFCTISLFGKVIEMYKRNCRQLRFEDFGQPAGMHLDPSNRWVQRAEEIPWDLLEEKYASLFPGRSGNVAKPVRLVVGAFIIQTEYGWSDEETAAMIRENPYMQFFCGFRSFDDSAPPFNPTCMVNFRKRLASDAMQEVADIVAAALRRKRVTRRACAL